MKKFLGNLNYPFVLFSAYLVKSVLLPDSLIDVSALSIIALLFLGDKLIRHAGKGVDEFFAIKREVISENMFRAKVNDDMGKLAQEVQILKAQGGQAFQSMTPKRR